MKRHFFLLALTLALASPLAAQVRVADIWPGSDGSQPQFLTVYEGDLFFAASDGMVGTELHAYAAATGTSRLVADIGESGGAFDGSPQNLTVYNGRLCFFAQDLASGNELRCYDADTDAVELIADLKAGAEGARPLYSRGTALYGDASRMAVLDSVLYFAAEADTTGMELWQYDSRTGVVERIFDVLSGPESAHPRYLTAFDNAVYFAAESLPEGDELWRYIPFSDQAIRVTDLVEGTGDSDPENLFVWEGTLYFSATNCRPPCTGGTGVGRELWMLNPKGGLQQAADVFTGSSSSDPASFAALGDRLYFSAHHPFYGREIWSYHASESPRLEDDLINGTTGSYPDNLFVHDDTLYFQGKTSRTGFELFSFVPGRDPAVELVADLDEGRSNSFPSQFVAYAGGFCFNARTNTTDYELYCRGVEVGAATAADPQVHPASAPALTLAGVHPVRGEHAALMLHLPRPMPVRVRAFDVLGRAVAVVFEGTASEAQPLNWKLGPDVAAGLYLLRAEYAGGRVALPVVIAR